ncbi:MAG: DNA-directed RNA polymerase subunit omega [Ruminococcaceae bacterium]|nr:DNA-directed RNA polymerase subunit omega [Oscillospiraceae bacterium]
MLNPDLRNVLTGKTSRYSLVLATAKRAREIAEDAEEKGEIIVEKPVTLAVNEFIDGKFIIEEPEDIRDL